MKAQILYGRSKISVANETGNYQAYQKMRYVEMLELLCRVAYYVFKKSPPNTADVPFDKQLE